MHSVSAQKKMHAIPTTRPPRSPPSKHLYAMLLRRARFEQVPFRRIVPNHAAEAVCRVPNTGRQHLPVEQGVYNRTLSVTRPSEEGYFHVVSRQNVVYLLATLEQGRHGRSLHLSVDLLEEKLRVRQPLPYVGKRLRDGILGLREPLQGRRGLFGEPRVVVGSTPHGERSVLRLELPY